MRYVAAWPLVLLLFQLPARCGEPKTVDAPTPEPSPEEAKTAEPAGPPEWLRLTDWKLTYNKKRGRYEGQVGLCNHAEQSIEEIGIRVEIDDRQAQRIGRTRWLALKGMAPEAVATKRFAFKGPPEFGVLYLRVRYFFAPDRDGENVRTRRKGIKSVMGEQMEKEDMDSQDEIFFSLDKTTPSRYSDAALDAAIARATGQTEGATAGPTGTGLVFGELTTAADGSLRLALTNNLKPLAAGALTIELTLKTDQGEPVKTLRQTVRKALAQGASIQVAFPDPGVEFFGFEVGYRY